MTNTQLGDRLGDAACSSAGVLILVLHSGCADRCTVLCSVVTAAAPDSLHHARLLTCSVFFRNSVGNHDRDGGFRRSLVFLVPGVTAVRRRLCSCCYPGGLPGRFPVPLHSLLPFSSAAGDQDPYPRRGTPLCPLTYGKQYCREGCHVDIL
jgi:hypothetical protein